MRRREFFLTVFNHGASKENGGALSPFFASRLEEKFTPVKTVKKLSHHTESTNRIFIYLFYFWFSGKM